MASTTNSINYNKWYFLIFFVTHWFSYGWRYCLILVRKLTRRFTSKDQILWPARMCLSYYVSLKTYSTAGVNEVIGSLNVVPASFICCRNFPGTKNLVLNKAGICGNFFVPFFHRTLLSVKFFQRCLLEFLHHDSLIFDIFCT